ncbi:unnamed protein product [marine sediment metagenome]|uniref:Uncharacterized protein n=1 Tax=marine sediment metagenome TaxID=412755 RepID=X0XNS2_9ZZZZ
MAEAFSIKGYLDRVYTTNLGHSGGKDVQAKLDRLHMRLDFLMMVEPKTDVDKLAKWKKITSEKRARARKKDKKKKKVWVKVDLKKEK